MPQNGEINTKFGVYASACCGSEIIIREGATFPDCARHPKMITTWQPIEADIVDEKVAKKKSSEHAA